MNRLEIWSNFKDELRSYPYTICAVVLGVPLCIALIVWMS